MTLFKEVEEQRDHIKLLLHDTQIERDQLNQTLILAEERENVLKMMLCAIMLVFVLWKSVTWM